MTFSPSEFNVGLEQVWDEAEIEAIAKGPHTSEGEMRFASDHTKLIDFTFDEAVHRLDAGRLRHRELIRDEAGRPLPEAKPMPVLSRVNQILESVHDILQEFRGEPSKPTASEVEPRTAAEIVLRHLPPRPTSARFMQQLGAHDAS
jgi:hypothetical protein